MDEEAERHRSISDSLKSGTPSFEREDTVS